MIEKVKLPLIAGAAVFVLFFIINIIVGNSFAVIILRSLISGLVVSALAAGLIFLYENYFLNDIKNTEPESKSEDQGIDIVLDDEGSSEKSADSNYTESTEGTDLDLNDNIESDDGINVDIKQTDDMVDTNKKMTQNNNNLEDEDINKGDTKELNIDNFNVNADEEPIETVTENKSAYTNYSEVNSGGKSIKERLGVDVSYDDVAKAIRTKFKEE